MEGKGQNRELGKIQDQSILQLMRDPALGSELALLRASHPAGARADMRGRVREGSVRWRMIGSIVGTKEREDMHAATRGGMKT
jgi:hypothetical protein